MPKARAPKPIADKPSPEGYRSIMWMLARAAAGVAARDPEMLKSVTRALNSVSKAATADKQLADLAQVHATVLELRKRLSSRTGTAACVRHSQSARVIEDDDHDRPTGSDDGGTAGAVLGGESVH